MSTNNPDDRPIRPIFVLTVNGAVIVTFSDGQHMILDANSWAD